MGQRRIIKWVVGSIILILIGGYLLCKFWLLPYLVITSSGPPPDRTPEQIFSSDVLNGQSVPEEITKIQAIQGQILFGYAGAPAFIRFEATPTFITELIEKDLYSPIPCDQSYIEDNLIQKVHKEVGYYKTPGWWKPSEIVSPKCYSSSNCVPYEANEKYLLINSNGSEGYFFRRAVCTLCPGGSRQSYECKPIRFQ